MRALVVVLVALVLAPGAGATVNLTAIETRVGDHPRFVRVVVEFTDGDLKPFEPTLLDPAVWGDGRTRVEVAHPGIRTEARSIRRHGIRVAFVQGRDRIVVRLAAAGHRFKYVSYRVLASPERLVIDLWKARPPVAGAEIRDDGCLRVTRFSGGPGFSMEGLELRPLFEHTVVVRVRGDDGRVLGQRPVIAVARRWGASFDLTPPRPQAGTLEAVSLSAKDGSLECLVQLRVSLPV